MLPVQRLFLAVLTKSEDSKCASWRQGLEKGNILGLIHDSQSKNLNKIHSQAKDNSV